MFGNKSFEKYLNLKNEVRDFGVRRDKSWISVTIMFVSSWSLLTKYCSGYQIVGWEGHETRIGETGDAGRVLVEKYDGKITLWEPSGRWEDNIKMYHREIGLGRGLNWSGSGSEKRQMVRSCERGNDSFFPPQGAENFLTRWGVVSFCRGACSQLLG